MARLLLPGFLCCVTAYVHAQDVQTPDLADENQTYNLKGLKAVSVVVQELDPDLKKSGVSETQVKTDTEERLKRSGIEVLSGKQRLQAPGQPYLFIVIVSACDDVTSLCALDVGVRVVERVRLVRDSQIETNTSIWRQEVITVRDKDHLGEARKLVSDFVEQFKAALQIANPIP